MFVRVFVFVFVFHVNVWVCVEPTCVRTPSSGHTYIIHQYTLKGRILQIDIIILTLMGVYIYTYIHTPLSVYMFASTLYIITSICSLI